MQTQNFEEAREKMIKGQLVSVGIDSALLLEAIRSIPKENFVPPEFRPITYSSKEIPVSKERVILEPMVMGKMVKFCNIHSDHKVLVLGDASGYLSALLTYFTKNITVLEKPEYCGTLRENLAKLNIEAVKVVEGSLTQGHLEGAPYDIIIISGSIKHLPDELKAQLTQNGFVMAARKKGYICEMVQYFASSDGFSEHVLFECNAFPLPDFPLKSSFKL